MMVSGLGVAWYWRDVGSAFFEAALALLDAAAIRVISEVFEAWTLDSQRARLCANIRTETALAAADFYNLLKTFALELKTHGAADPAWVNACRAHQLRGRALAVSECPGVLGKARALDDHALAIAKASSGVLTPGEVRRLLLKGSRQHELPGFEPFLKLAPLGRHLIWATFDLNHSDANPFDSMPDSHQGVCCALGLGHATPDEPLVLLAWRHDATSTPLYRPTIADAASSIYYLPVSAADASWGLTAPLPPNPSGISGQPEVVLRVVTSHGLQLPFRIVRA